jgi:hypothetical protein
MSEEDGTKALQAVLEHIATNPGFRKRLEEAPFETLDEFGIEVDQETRAALEGKRFSEFVSEIEARAADSGGDRRLTPEEADMVVGGYAPPYVPVGPVNLSTLTQAWSELLAHRKVDRIGNFDVLPNPARRGRS